MATAPDNELPKSLKLLQVFWPIGLALAIGGSSIVQATGAVAEVERRVDSLEKDGPPVVRERLARIEALQQAQTEQLTRMEQKLDDLDKRSRDRNLHGL